MTDVPEWVQTGPYAGLAAGILWLALWFFGLRHSMAEKGWKHLSLSFPVLGIFVLTGSVLNVLLGWTPALSTGVALGWILILAIMVAGMMLDLRRRTRQST
jgi:FtsH-binding integral membrane protein